MQQNHRNRLVLIWLAILCAVAGAIWVQSWRSPEDADDASAATSGDVAPIGLEAELTGKIVMVLNDFRSSGAAMSTQQVLDTAEPLALKDAPFSHRLAHTVIVGEVKGWVAGIEEAKALEPANDSERSLRDSLVAVMQTRVPDAFGKPDPDACAQLAPKLGYFARVVCGEPGVAKEGWRMMLVLIAAVTWYVCVFVAGIAVLIYMLVRLAKGAAPARAALPTDAPTSLVLGETFAIWMVLFFALNIGAGALGHAIVGAAGLEDSPHGMHVSLFISLVAFLGSLVVLVYPTMRGVGRAQLYDALGWHRGRGVVREALEGVLCYLSAVPLLAVGLVVYAVLSAIVTLLFGAPKQPGHPIVELFADADALRIVLVLLMASVAAPIVEETMFRGAFYGHLRAIVLPRHRVVSGLVSAVVSSFVFAVIHPQGALFAPALSGLALGFCLFRETRGSLIAPMVAHGINNAVTLALGLMLLS